MEPDAINPFDEELAALLAACDDDLAKGDQRSSLRAVRAVEGAGQERLRKKLACVEALRRILQPSGSGLSETSKPSHPTEIGRFRILGELGSGGYGIVYRAFDPVLGRDVALKIPRDDVLLTASLRTRFQTEARAAAGLSHPNIVTVFEAGEIGSTLYIASAFCDGPALDEWLRNRKEPVPARTAAGILLALAEATRHAHERGVLHRDLKPANILFGSTDLGVRSAERNPTDNPLPSTPEDRTPNAAPHPMITDFGLAKLHSPFTGDADSEADLRDRTRSGAIVGTPAYMAPEQAAGRVRDAGPAADVYSLGAILYELLTGRPPFVADTVLDTLQLVRSAEPVSPARLRAKVPRDLETICLKCLEKEPRRRYATAADLAADLLRFLDGRPVLARPVSTAERWARWVRRHPTRAPLLAVSVVALLTGGGVVVGAIYNGRLEVANARLHSSNTDLAASLDETRTAREGEANARLRSEAAFDRTDRMAYLLRISRADGERRANRFTEARRLLDACPPEKRGWEWRFLWDQTDDHAVEFRGHHGAVNQIAFDPNGRRVATAGRDETVRIWDAATGRELAKLPLERAVPGLAYSPDGSRLAAATGDGSIPVWAVSADSPAELLYTLKGHTGCVTRVGFSADGKQLVSAGQDQTVRTWDLAAGVERSVLRGPAAEPTAVLFGRNAQSVQAAFAHSGTLPAQTWEWDLATGIGKKKLTGFQCRNPLLAVRPFGGEILSLLQSKLLRFTSPDGSPAWDAIPMLDTDVTDLAFSPSGLRLAVGRSDGEIHHYDLLSGTWRLVTRLPRHQGAVLSVAFDPTSRLLATCGEDGRVSVSDLSANRPPVRVPAPSDASGFTTNPAFTADGRELAVGCLSGDVWFFDAATGAIAPRYLPSPSPSLPNRGVAALACSPVGGTLVAAWTGSPKARLYVGGKPGPVLTNPRPVSAVAFSNDGRHVVTGAGNEVRVWDVSTGRERAVLVAPTQLISGLAYHPDGRHLVATGGSKPSISQVDWVWDLESPGEPKVFRKAWEDFTFTFSVHGDGWVPRFTADMGLTLHDSLSARPPRPLCADAVDFCWASHPDGKLLAVGRKGNTISFFDTTEAVEILSIRSEGRTVTRLAFDPTGRRLAGIAGTNELIIWDTPPPAR